MKKYELLQVLSENKFIRSWHIKDKISNNSYFAKSINPETEFDKNSIKRILENSYKLQQNIRNNGFVTSIAKFKEEGSTYYVYPFLDLNKWQLLKIDDISFEVITKLCVLIDNLHLLNLVHADLKLSNFLIKKENNKFELKLVDYDFLCENESKPNRNIFGTPKYIAPEILNNDTVLIQSDNYSFGNALNKFENFSYSNTDIDKDKFKSFIDNLIDPDPLKRPQYLIDALRQYELLDAVQYDKINKTILLNLLETSFNQNSKNNNIKSIFKKLKVFGFTNELIEDIQNSNQNTFKLLSCLVEKTSVYRFNNYWLLQEDDHTLIYTFEMIHESNNDINVFFDYYNFKKSNILKKADEYVENGEDNKAYLIYKKICDTKYYNSLSVKEKFKAANNTADYLIGQNRIKEALHYLQKLLEELETTNEMYLDTYFKIVKYCLGFENEQDSNQLLKNGIALSKENNSIISELKFLRLKAWYLCSKGHTKEAFDILKSVKEISKNEKLTESLIQTYYMYGVLCWSTGKYIDAKTHYLKSYETAKQNNQIDKVLSTLLSLATTSKILGNYNDVIKYGKIAVKYIKSVVDKPKLSNLYINLGLSSIFIGDYKSAQSYLLKSLETSSSSKIEHFVFFQHAHDVLKMYSGDYKNATHEMHHTLKLTENNQYDNIRGNTYLNLGELYFYTGENIRCNENLEKAKQVFSNHNDESSLAIIETIRILNDYYYTDQTILYDNKILNLLLETKSRYYACLYLIHLVLNNNTISGDLAASFNSFIANSETPLFRVTSLLFQEYSENNEVSISTLKKCYQMLDSINARFLSLLLCQSIADLYLKNSDYKYAYKYFHRALCIAENINNVYYFKKITKSIESFDISGYERDYAIDALHGVAEIINNVKDHDESLEKLIYYAMRHTGAERGVLLLKNVKTNKLNVESYVNCDDDSLNDISDFSKSIPSDVDDKNLPLIIENALNDDRTKKYNSIIAHNILSVICIPLKISKNIQGVLYLDNHTLPSLFSKDDIKFVSSIASILSSVLNTILEFKKIFIINKQLVDEASVHNNFIGENAKIKKLFNGLPEIAKSKSPILIVGESGTGKEIISNIIHRLSNRKDNPLIKVNCTALADNLVDSELFGIKKNVATGVDKRDGKFAAANNGTIFFDEIGDMPLSLQPKILRTIEYGEYYEVGSNRLAFTDIRCIYATNKDIDKLILKNLFREDLYFRINTIIIEIPPLRDRKDDIELLLHYFQNKFLTGVDYSIFSVDALTTMSIYDWPGNVRELRNLVERCCIHYKGNKLGVDALPDKVKNFIPSKENKEAFEKKEKFKIINCLNDNNWNVSKVSRILNIQRSTLDRKIKKYNINKTNYPK